MKQLVLVMASVTLICYSTSIFAQQEAKEKNDVEKIILDDKNNEAETIIEIKGNKLYVDGQLLKTLDKNTEVKIVKKNTANEQRTETFFKQFDRPFTMPEGGTAFNVQSRAMLGVKTKEAENGGAEVAEVVAGSAAEKAGLLIGDIITAVDDKIIGSPADLVKSISNYEAGEKIKIDVKRKGTLKDLTATLDKNNQSAIGIFKGLDQLKSLNFDDIFNGEKMMVQTINPNIPKIGMEVEENERGALVINVHPNSQAEKAGIKKGDIIKSIQGEKTDDLQDISYKLTKSQNEDTIAIQIQRNGAIKTLNVETPRAKKSAEF